MDSIKTYIKLTEEKDGNQMHLYFSSETSFTDEDVDEFVGWFGGDCGIIDEYIMEFPDRKLSITMDRLASPPTRNENTEIINVKHKDILIDNLGSLGEMAGKGLFSDFSHYKEKGFFVYYENYEIKEKKQHILTMMEDGEEVDEDEANDIDDWLNQPGVF